MEKRRTKLWWRVGLALVGAGIWGVALASMVWTAGLRWTPSPDERLNEATKRTDCMVRLGLLRVTVTVTRPPESWQRMTKSQFLADQAARAEEEKAYAQALERWERESAEGERMYVAAVEAARLEGKEKPVKPVMRAKPVNRWAGLVSADSPREVSDLFGWRGEVRRARGWPNPLRGVMKDPVGVLLAMYIPLPKIAGAMVSVSLLGPMVAGVGMCVPLGLWLRRRGRAEKGLCEGCGYDLRESPGGCPECGKGRG